jgi:hypothetical protein
MAPLKPQAQERAARAAKRAHPCKGLNLS